MTADSAARAARGPAVPSARPAPSPAPVPPSADAGPRAADVARRPVAPAPPPAAPTAPAVPHRVVAITGRSAGAPADVWRDEVLAPQLDHEVRHLLPHHVAIEKVLLLEYLRMGLLDDADVGHVAHVLHGVTPGAVASAGDGLPAIGVDVSSALERLVRDRLAGGPAAWHVDRSVNDVQATAQRMYARDQVLATADALLTLDTAAARLAARSAEHPMPGHARLPAAQVITPGFWLAAVCAEAQRVLRRLLASYAEIDACPLGAGAMAGQELPWARERMAALLGFSGAAPHALVAVASRGWTLSVAADLSGLGVALSRFCTDLIAWGSGGRRFVDLPDALTGNSPAAPHQRDLMVLERIRARTAHLSTLHLDLAIGQRNTAYTDVVEVSTEADAHLPTMFDAARSVLRLFTTVLAGLKFDADAMRAACESEHLGGFTLANLLTVRAGLPWTEAQAVAGRYVAAAVERSAGPAASDGGGALLAALAAQAGHRVADPESMLVEAFTVPGALAAKRSGGSTNPRAVAELLDTQCRQHDELAATVNGSRSGIDRAIAGIDAALGLDR